MKDRTRLARLAVLYAAGPAAVTALTRRGCRLRPPDAAALDLYAGRGAGRGRAVRAARERAGRLMRANRRVVGVVADLILASPELVVLRREVEWVAGWGEVEFAERAAGPTATAWDRELAAVMAGPYFLPPVPSGWSAADYLAGYRSRWQQRAGLSFAVSRFRVTHPDQLPPDRREVFDRARAEIGG